MKKCASAKNAVILYSNENIYNVKWDTSEVITTKRIKFGRDRIFYTNLHCPKKDKRSKGIKFSCSIIWFGRSWFLLFSK